MKIKFYIASLLFTVSMAVGQTIEQQQSILKTYDSNAGRELQRSLKEKDKERQLRIERYLAANSKVQNDYVTAEGRKFKIMDIVDGKPVYVSTDNAQAAKAARTNKMYPGGGLGLSLEGENMAVGVWDGGWIKGNHVEFQTSATNTVSRVSYPDNGSLNPESDLHGTHVGGTVGARGALAGAKGMAPKSKIRSYNWDGDKDEVTTDILNNALLISNHSYGVPIFLENGTMNVPTWYMGCYNDTAAEWDAISYTFPYYLMVASAGNNGDNSYVGGFAEGYDKLTGNKTSKNSLIVANANPVINFVGAFNSLEINSSSSQGPTDDGRIKPDIAADGTNLNSTSNSTTAPFYATLTGTSMASPSVAGSILLLQEHYKNLNPQFMKAATLKALVCHTAHDDPAMAGPDAKFGFGFLDMEAAAKAISSKSTNQALIVESQLNGTTTSYTVSVSVTNPNDLKATLCWTDPAAAAKNGSLNNTSPVLVNDLDVRITSSDGTVYYPWKLQMSDVSAQAIKGDNIVDNVEKIELAGATGTNFTVTVTHKNTLVSGSQAFSLVVTGTNMVLGTPETALEKITYWPNPTTDRLYYKLANGNSAESFSVYDISGKQMNLRVTNDYIDVSGLSQGVYILKLNTDTSSNTYKFIKK